MPGRQRQAAPKAEALAAALFGLTASGTSRDAQRAAAARATSLIPRQIGLPVHDFGRACVSGTVDDTGKAHVEVGSGRDVLRGPGGH
ncbi:hypothetical protein PV703_18900 [Streptomyces sp. ME01-24h]|nr:hypothetical protein [Streptomyces sp. ME01-24h]